MELNSTYLDTVLPHWHYSSPLKRKPFAFELESPVEHLAWVDRNYYWIMGVGVIYFLMVHLGPKWMAKREPFDLRRPLAVWNFAFGLFSMVAFVRIFPDFADIWWGSEDGPHQLVCER